MDRFEAMRVFCSVIEAGSFAAAMQERALLAGQTVGITLCGGNVDSDTFAKVLQKQ